MDLGTGIANFYLYPEIERATKIIIILSHYHLDHIIGLIYLLNICKNKEVIIYGPGEFFYGESCEKILNRLINPPFFSRKLSEFSRKLSICDYNEETIQVSPNFRVEFILQSHSQPSFGIYVNESLYYATDTSVLENTFRKASNAKLLLHECWNIDDISDKHSSLNSILELSSKYKLREVKLIHINPNWSSSDFVRAMSLIENNKVSFLNDGDEFEL